MNNRILVTGGAGFIGSNFIRYILTNTADTYIVNLDLLTYAGSLENLRTIVPTERYKFIKGDIRDQALVENILSAYKIDTIVNFAAETHVDRSILNPDTFITTNINGTFSLLEASRKIWLDGNDDIITRFHHVSTDEVFGALEPNELAFNETTPYNPNSPYSASKASSDHLVRAYNRTYGLPISISNCSNNYGRFQFPEKLIPLIILNALQNKPLPIYGDGKQIRDWIYVEDHCDAIWKIITKGKSGETYVVGAGNQPTNLEIVKMICDILDEELNLPKEESRNNLIKFVTDRPGHDRRYAMDIRKINKDLDWYPKHEISGGLKKTVKWYLHSIDWVNKIQKQDQYGAWITKNYEERK